MKLPCWVPAFALLSPVQGAVLTGGWFLEPAVPPGQFRLTLTRNDVIVDARRTIFVAPADLKGFRPTDLESPGASVRFELLRDAGEFRFEGMAQGGKAEGRFEFRENAAFAASLRGVIRDWWDPGRMFALGLENMPAPAVRSAQESQAHLRDSSYLEALKRTGYVLFRPDTSRLEAHGVSPDLLRQMKLSGYDSLSVTDMIRLQTHGVTTQDIRSFEARGRTNLTVDDIVKLKVNGVN